MLDLGTLKIGIEADTKDAKSNLNAFKKDVRRAESDTTKSNSKIDSSFEAVDETVSKLKETSAKTCEGMKKDLDKVKASASTTSKEVNEKLQPNLEALKPAFDKVGAAGNRALRGIRNAAIAAAGAVAGLTKQAFDEIANYEQLEGGVEKVFDTASEKMLAFAKDSYEVTGLGANTYLENAMKVSSFAVKSAGNDFELAADKVNQMMIQAADNASVYGTNLSDVIDVYKSLAKGQYETLDNLLLPYGGTKEGLQNLLADAEKISGIKYDLNNFNDVIDAIGVIQEEMGIAGNAQEESADTLEGSINKVKGAYQNWLISLNGSDEDIQQSTTNLATSFGDATKKVVPKLQSIVTALKDSIPDSVTPAISAVAGLTAAFVAMKSSMKIAALISSATTAINALKAANEGATLAQILLNSAMKANPAVLIVSLIMGVVAALVTLWNTNEGFRDSVVNAFTTIITTVQGFFTAMEEGVYGAIDNFLLFVSSVGSTLVDFFTVTIPTQGQKAIDWFKSLPSKILKALGDLGTLLYDSGKNIISGMKDGLLEKWNDIKNWFSEKMSWLKDEASNAGDTVAEATSNGEIVPTPVKHAKGGIFTKPTLLGGGRHLVGEAGSEAIIPLNQSVLATMGAGMAAAYAGAGGSMGSTTNVYINGAKVNSDSAISSKFYELLTEMARKGMM